MEGNVNVHVYRHIRPFQDIDHALVDAAALDVDVNPSYRPAVGMTF